MQSHPSVREKSPLSFICHVLVRDKRHRFVPAHFIRREEIFFLCSHTNGVCISHAYMCINVFENEMRTFHRFLPPSQQLEWFCLFFFFFSRICNLGWACDLAASKGASMITARILCLYLERMSHTPLLGTVCMIMILTVYYEYHPHILKFQLSWSPFHLI